MHMTIYRINRSRGHKFFFSLLLFGFSMARIAAMSMRLAWSQHPTNADVAIAAGVFTAAGVLLLFLVNLFFAQRVVRAYLPEFGWSQGVRWSFRFLIGSVIAVLIMVVTVSVHMFFTGDLEAKARERHVQLFAGTYLAVLAFVPIPVVLASRIVAGRAAQDNSSVVQDKFGTGRFRTKIWLLMSTSALLTLGAGFRAAISFVPRPMTDPAWYHSKPAYYCFNFVIELIVTYAYGVSRFDRRFHVPDGSSKPGDYSARTVRSKVKEGEQSNDETGSKSTGEGSDPTGPAWEEQYAYAGRRSVTLEPAKKEVANEQV